MGQYGKYLYAYAEWGPGRFSLADPANPTMAGYYPMTSNCVGKIGVGGDGYQAGDRMAVAEAPDGSSAIFVNWKLYGSGTYPVYAVKFSTSGNATLAGGVNYDPGSGHMDGLWISNHYYGYIPARISGVQSVGVVDAANPTVSAGVIAWTTSWVRARTLDVPSAGSNYLVAAGGSKVYVALLGSNGLPAQQNVTTVSPYVAGEADIAAVNGVLYVFVNGTGPASGGGSTAGISVFQVNADLSLTLVPSLSGTVIPAQVAGMTVSGKPFPAIVALSGGDLRIFGTRWLAAGSCPPTGPDIAYNRGANDPPITISIMDGFTLPNYAGVMAYRFVDIAQPNPGLTLRADFFKAACILADTTLPPTAGVSVANTSPHYATDQTNYFGDTFNVADASSSGAPLLEAQFDLNYPAFTSPKGDIDITSSPFTAPSNLYLPCDPSAGGSTSGTGCYTSVGTPTGAASFAVADRSFNKNGPSANTAAQSINFRMPQASVANFFGGAVQVLTGGNLDATPTTGRPQAFCWMWSATATPPAPNTTFSGCGSTGPIPSPAMPGTAKAFSLAVGYYPDNALPSSLSGQVQQTDVMPNLTWSPSKPAQGGSFTVTATRQKGASISVAQVDIWIDQSGATGQSASYPGCSALQPVPCSLYSASGDLNGPKTAVAPANFGTGFYIHLRYTYTGGTSTTAETAPQAIEIAAYQPTPAINITGSGVSFVLFSTPHWHVTQGSQASFTDSTLADQGHITTASWDFGNGDVAQVNGDATSVPANYAYPMAGTYTVNLCVNNQTTPPGCVSDQVAVDPSGPFTVSATANPSSTLANQSVSFSISVTGGYGGTPACDWNFGDGGPHSSSCSTIHTYAAAGSYNASVGVTTSGGDSGTGQTGVGVAAAGICGAGPCLAGVDLHSGTGTSSNLNGVLEPGESVLIEPSWTNTTGASLTLSGTASSFTGPSGATYTIGDSSASYGTVFSGATSDCYTATGNCYRLKVSNPATRPALHWDATFVETLSTGGTKTWTVHIGNSFTDVPTSNLFYKFVETLFHNGVTAGCSLSPPKFCPDDSITKAQMAVFILESKHGVGYQPPPATGTVFTDVKATDFAAAFIEELKAEGISIPLNQCGTDMFCPGATTTRRMMASMLLLGKHGAGYVPPAATGIFTDVPVSDPDAPWIEELYHEGITAGCQASPMEYCPDSPNTRGQMSVFQTATFGLQLY